jgi:hypothetical protein|tara:strand:+ start:1886 stop:2755 length:870 start_codon:yes stop_codon:yes gene_type:complete
MKYKVITTFKPGDWDRYAKRMVQSVLDRWPKADITVYCEGQRPNFNDQRVTWWDIDKANTGLLKFREDYRNDPVAVGKLDEIPGGIRRSSRLETEGGLDAKKESYLWNAVKFSYKVSCVTHAVRTYTDYDYVIWIDDDTYTFRDIPMQFIESICPNDTLVTYLDRENDRGSNKYPECGLVCYNIKHKLVQNFINDWEKLYTSADIFELLEWHDSYVFWHLTKEYRQKHSAKVHDIGYSKGVKGHHVFVNSELGQYIDHFKGDRKDAKSSKAEDIRKTPDLKKIDYWKNK